MQAYSITINLPEEYQSQLEVITQNYLNLISTDYIQSYETCKTGKLHSHIGYLALPQKSTSNETRKFKDCYPFKKQAYPNAIKHVQHDNMDLLVGYIVKSAGSDRIQTNLDDNYVQKCKNLYQTRSKKQKLVPNKASYMTVNDMGFGFIKYYQEHHKYYHTTEENDHRLLRDYFKTIQGKYLLTTYNRINKEKIIEYAKNHYQISEKFI